MESNRVLRYLLKETLPQIQLCFGIMEPKCTNFTTRPETPCLCVFVSLWPLRTLTHVAHLHEQIQMEHGMLTQQYSSNSEWPKPGKGKQTAEVTGSEPSAS